MIGNSIGRPRRTASPILSASIIVFCIFIMLRLRADFAFSRQSDDPTKITDITDIVEGRRGESNDYVKIKAMPDHSFVARVKVSEADYGQRVAPVVGTAAKVWVMVKATPWAI